jgi:hypothetical protein
MDVACADKNATLLRRTEQAAVFRGWLLMKVPRFGGLGSEWQSRWAAAGWWPVGGPELHGFSVDEADQAHCGRNKTRHFGPQQRRRSSLCLHTWPPMPHKRMHMPGWPRLGTRAPCCTARLWPSARSQAVGQGKRAKGDAGGLDSLSRFAPGDGFLPHGKVPLRSAPMVA